MIMVNNTVLHVETLLAEEILIILTTTKKKAKKGNYVRWWMCEQLPVVIMLQYERRISI